MPVTLPAIGTPRKTLRTTGLLRLEPRHATLGHAAAERMANLPDLHPELQEALLTVVDRVALSGSMGLPAVLTVEEALRVYDALSSLIGEAQQLQNMINGFVIDDRDGVTGHA